ncbi:MAG: chalcone isomerase family protein [Pseudomonadota bacterium]|nr:chalcone isomerase family protein [Pseudomonadota bacterium]
MAMTKLSFKALLAGALMAFAMVQGAVAAEISGVKFDDTVKVGGKDLKLNGLGMRTKFIVKVYAAGLYLPEKKNTVADILKIDGPRRMTLVMMREISSDEFGQAFMTGLNNNIDKAEKSKFVTQISKFGEMFGTIEGLKKGDTLHIDWIPGTGTVCELNGKKIGEVLQDVNYFNAVLKIWLGDKPVDSSLKPVLLGEAK